MVLGDREFHGPKLPEWLDSRGVMFALRQKKILQIQVDRESEYGVSRNICFHNRLQRLLDSS